MVIPRSTTAATSSRTNLAPTTKGCREWHAPMRLSICRSGSAPQQSFHIVWASQCPSYTHAHSRMYIYIYIYIYVHGLLPGWLSGCAYMHSQVVTIICWGCAHISDSTVAAPTVNSEHLVSMRVCGRLAAHSWLAIPSRPFGYDQV